jgi:hypothetical protein
MEGLRVTHFEDGRILFMTEEAYAKFKENEARYDLLVEIRVEEHWMDKRKAKEKYPWIN